MEPQVAVSLLDTAFSYYTKFHSAVSIVRSGFRYIENWTPLPAIYKKALAVTKCIDLFHVYESGQKTFSYLRGRRVEPIVLVEELTTEVLTSWETIVNAIDSLNYIGLPIQRAAKALRKLLPYTFIFDAITIPRDLQNIYRIYSVYSKIRSTSFNPDKFLEQVISSESYYCELFDLSPRACIKERAEKARDARLHSNKEQSVNAGVAGEFISFMRARSKQILISSVANCTFKSTYVICCIAMLYKKTVILAFIVSATNAADTIGYIADKLIIQKNPFSLHERWEIMASYDLIRTIQDQVKMVNASCAKGIKSAKSLVYTTCLVSVRYLRGNKLPYQFEHPLVQVLNSPQPCRYKRRG